MAQTLTTAQQLYRDNVMRLTDRGGPMALDAVQAVLDAALAALADADAEGRWSLWTLIGLAEMRLERAELALAAHLEAHALRPDDAQAASNVGKVLGILGRPREALQYLERAERNIGRNAEILSVVLCNQTAALHQLGETRDADAVFERAAAAAVARDDAFTYFRVAIAAALLDRDDDALEYFARYLCLAQKEERGGRPASEVVAAAPTGAIAAAAQNAALGPVLWAALRRAALPPPPTEDERARAREASRDETGFVDPFALAEALSAPLHGVVRSDDPDARFGRDPQIRALRRGHA